VHAAFVQSLVKQVRNVSLAQVKDEAPKAEVLDALKAALAPHKTLNDVYLYYNGPSVVSTPCESG